MMGQNRRNHLGRIGLLNEVESFKDITHNPEYVEPRGFCANDACHDPERRSTIKWYSVARVGVVILKTSNQSVDVCDWCGYYLYWSRHYTHVDGCTMLANRDVRAGSDMKKPVLRKGV